MAVGFDEVERALGNFPVIRLTEVVHVATSEYDVDARALNAHYTRSLPGPNKRVEERVTF